MNDQNHILEILAALGSGRAVEERIPTDVYAGRWEPCSLERALFLLGNRRAESLRIASTSEPSTEEGDGRLFFTQLPTGEYIQTKDDSLREKGYTVLTLFPEAQEAALPRKGTITLGAGAFQYILDRARANKEKTITPEELWEAIDGNSGIIPNKTEALEAARACAQACDEEMKSPQRPTRLEDFLDAQTIWEAKAIILEFQNPARMKLPEVIRRRTQLLFRSVAVIRAMLNANFGGNNS